MSVSTYTELVAAISTYMIYDEVGTQAPTIIELAEAVLNREIRVREMQTSEAYASQTAQAMTLPTDFLEMVDLYETGQSGGKLDYIAPRPFWALQESRTGSGQPRLYTTIGEELLLSPTPDQARGYVLHYFAELEPLTQSNASNVLLAKAPDVYLWQVLTQACLMIGDDDRGAEFRANYMGAKDSLHAADMRARHRPGASIRTRVTRDGAFRVA